MSFECANCGKGEVDKVGGWCYECQQDELYKLIDLEDKWFSSSRLCQSCIFPDGGDADDKCEKYNMPLSMVKRKNTCKHFKKRQDTYSEG